jgi:hypothetical protein
MFDNNNKCLSDSSSAQPLRNPVDAQAHRTARAYRLQRVRE